MTNVYLLLQHNPGLPGSIGYRPGAAKALHTQLRYEGISNESKAPSVKQIAGIEAAFKAAASLPNGEVKRLPLHQQPRVLKVTFPEGTNVERALKALKKVETVVDVSVGRPRFGAQARRQSATL